MKKEVKDMTGGAQVIGPGAHVYSRPDRTIEKPRYDLVPVSAVRAIATVFTQGAHGRDDHDWRYHPYEYSKCLASLERHIADFKEGKIDDVDTGLPVLWHAIARLAMLIEWESMPPSTVKNDLYGHNFEYQGEGK